MSTRPSVLNRAIVLGNRSGHLLPPSPPAEKATARQDQTRQSSTCDGGGDYHPSPSQVSTVRLISLDTAAELNRISEIYRVKKVRVVASDEIGKAADARRKNHVDGRRGNSSIDK